MRPFKKRPAHRGPVFVASYESSRAIEAWKPEAGNKVSVRTNGATIVITITLVDGSNYKGQVIGFEPPQCEPDGLKAGDDVQFSYEHIFTCSR